jgi:polysaccharide deacetylase 2 family uncharacterized protein YibQ
MNITREDPRFWDVRDVLLDDEQRRRGVMGVEDDVAEAAQGEGAIDHQVDAVVDALGQAQDRAVRELSQDGLQLIGVSRGHAAGAVHFSFPA